MYNYTLSGMSLLLTQDQLSEFISCYRSKIKYIEQDGVVFKAEGGTGRANAGNWHPSQGLRSLVVFQTDDVAPPSFPSFPQRTSASTTSRPSPSSSRNRKLLSSRRRWKRPRRALLSQSEPPSSSPSDASESPLSNAQRIALLDRIGAESNASLNFQIYPLPLPLQNPATASMLLNASSGPDDGSIPILNGQPLQVPSDAERDPNNYGPKIQNLHPALWNLDRIDQRAPPLDQMYHYGWEGTNVPPGPGKNGMGKGVTIYAVDSGVRETHQEFGDWAGGPSRASYGWDFVEDDGANAGDCDGHGTHVASTAIGRTVGVAKGARLVAVRVLDCQGSGSVSDTIAGLDWVAQNAQRPAVVTLSLGISVGEWSRALEDAVRGMVVDHGITVVIAAGNSATDSCFIAPADVREAITVSATNLNTKFSGATSSGDFDTLYTYANTGLCVDIFAPGVDIYGACGGDARCGTATDYTYVWATGTSMAVPHVAGTAAIYLGDNPTATPQEVENAIVQRATRGRISGPQSLMRSGTPNLLLYNRAISTVTPQVTASEGPTD